MEKEEKEERKKIIVPFLPDRLENIAKKLTCTIMASFQAKIGWKWLRKRENKNYIFVTFLPDWWLEKIAQNSKNFKIRLWHHFKPK